MNDEKLHDIIIQLAQWHQNRVERCQMILDNKNADICLNMGGDDVLEFGADTKEARFIRIGVQLALLQFQPFPVTLKRSDDSMEDDADE